MMKRLTAGILIAALALLGLSCGQSDRPVVLKFKFEPGLQLTYTQNSTDHVKTTEGDSVTRDLTEQVKAQVVQTVRRVLDDGTAQVEEVSRWNRSVSGKADSAAADTSTQSRTISIYSAPNGKIVDLVFETPMDSTNAAYLRSFYDQNSVIFPDTAVRPGGEWTQSSSVSVEGTKMEASTTYRVVGFVSDQGYDCAKISYEGTLIIPIVSSASDTTQRRGLDRINMSGTLTFATDLGMLVSVNEKWAINGDRQKTLAGKTVKTKVAIEMNVAYVLQERKPGPSGR